MNNDGLGMIIGRFQHLHVGHVEMIEKGFSVCHTILLLVGSAQESGTIRNPFDINIRMDLINLVFKKRNRGEAIICCSDK